jgi:myo-inositol-1(or 4)-monophosphatase
MQKGVVTQAVVYDPSRDELFTATRGRGAYLNGRRIRVSKRLRIEESLIGTGFPIRKLDMLDGYLAMMRVVMERAAGLRRPGAAALDLAYVAAGRLDGFFELGLAPWDAAAGSLLITEAGGMVGNFGAEGDYLFSEQIVAGTPKVFAGLIALLHRHVVAAEAAVSAASAKPVSSAPSSPAAAEGSTDDARRDPTRRVIRPTRKRADVESGGGQSA